MSREHGLAEIGYIVHPDHENELVKGEWQSELVYAILDREWRSVR